MSEELKTCPFCGSTSGHYEDHANDCWIRMIRNIGWQNKTYNTDEMATAWNHRQADTELVKAFRDCMSYVDIDNLTMQAKEKEWEQALAKYEGK